jgi:hypothetical protein
MRGILVERAQQRARIMPQGMFMGNGEWGMGNGEWGMDTVPHPHSTFPFCSGDQLLLPASAQGLIELN